VLGRRPEVRVRVRRNAVRAGRTFDAEIVLRTPRELRIEGVDVDFEGTERFAYGAKRDLAYEHVAQHIRLKPQTLPKGVRRERVSFSVPAGAPASYSGGIEIRYSLKARVRIPWALDPTAKMEVVVKSAARKREPTTPGTFTTNPGGSTGTVLTMEVAIADRVLRPGDTLQGRLALVNLGRRRPTAVIVRLVSYEEPADGSMMQLFSNSPDAATILKYPLRAREFVDGEPVEFRCRVPKSAPPAFDGHFVALRWYLVIVAELGRDPVCSIRIPVTILPGRARPPSETATETALAPIGRQRRKQVWSAVAGRFELRGDTESEKLSGSVGRVSIGIRLEPASSACTRSRASSGSRWGSTSSSTSTTEGRTGNLGTAKSTWAGRHPASVFASAAGKRGKFENSSQTMHCSRL
jgi:hypothetical protein